LLKSKFIFGNRLRKTRKSAGLTQEELAVHTGIDELSASARMSQYENGVHVPKYEMALRLAEVLQVPVEYFYTSDENTAELLLLWGQLSRQDKKKLLSQLQSMTGK